MKILYIFPHPDDESFGPAVAMHKQKREGHEVHLLTLTKGEATKVRHKLHLSKEDMGRIREEEMKHVAEVLSLASLTVLDLPDSALKEMNPLIIEEKIEKQIHAIHPDVVVTYPVHGISGFHDHLVTHAVVKRVFETLQGKEHAPKRLAFYTLNEEDASISTHFRLSFSNSEEIDCIESGSDTDLQATLLALDCYKTYTDTIEASGIRKLLNKNVAFEFYREECSPPLNNIFTNLKHQQQ
jgi:N-acetylglucosamine malate deacetylase 2